MGTPSKSSTEKEEEIKEEYLKTLQDLQYNSKPLIDVLTEVAEENKEYASTIADCIVEQLEKVADPLKLPILYLIDSIIKNIGQHYMFLFCKNIDRLFAKVYEQGDENVRNKLMKLRFTWNNLLPLKTLSSLDKMVQIVNPSWPTPAVHVNPKFVSISANVTSANGITTTRIAPVSSELINAAKRVRDPRLRKIELQQIRPANNNSSCGNKDAKIPLTASSTCSAPQIDAKIDQKNDRRKRTEVSESAPKSEIKEVKKRVEVKVIQDKPSRSASNNVGKEPKSKIEPKPKIDAAKAKKEDKPAKIKEMLDEWVNSRKEDGKEKKTERKVWSKEERNEALQAIAKMLIAEEESDNILVNLGKTHPKIAQILKKLMEKLTETGKGDATEEKRSPAKKSSTLEAYPKSAKRAKKPSPKPKPKSNPSPVPIAVVPPPVEVPVPVQDTLIVPVTSAPIQINDQAPINTPVFTAASVPVTGTVVNTTAISSVVTVADKPATTSISISVTSSSPVTSLVSPPMALSPAIPIPPPAPIISAAAAAEQSKTQDIDYRQLFVFPFSVPPVVAEEEPKPVKMEIDESEIIDVDALPSKSKSRKRKSDEKSSRRDRKKKRTSSTSSNDSVASKSSVESVGNKCLIPEIVKIDEEEVNSPETDAKKSKQDDSFYSQTAPNEEKLQTSNLIIMSVSESSRAKSNSPPMFPKLDSNFGAKFSNTDFNSQSITPEIPPTDMNIVDMIDDDPVRSINIDGVSREIRHYGSSAVVFMNWDDPREISFFNGVRNVIIDDKFGIPCSLNAPEVETLVYGKKHRFRLGVPTRELYVNGVGYECYFGGPPIKVRLDYKNNYIKLEGPPPSVNIGTVKRVDLVAGKINIIINDQNKHPIYLDAKPQYFLIDGKPIVLMFIDGLKRVLINNVPFRTDFGGPSQSFKIMNKIYQFRFTVLPLGIVPGINLSQMVVTKLPSPPPLPPQFQFSVSDNLPTPPMPPAALTTAVVPPIIDLDPPTNNAAAPPSGVDNILGSISIDELFQKLVASGIVPNVDNKNEEESDAVKIVDFRKPETLKQRQPALIKMLYSGIQCGSCGLRFPAEQTLKYSQHLDWHFRLNRKGKDGARTIHSRKWYYARNDWIKFQEMEDNTDRGTSWFDNHPVTEYTEEVIEDVPSIPARSNQNDASCELCRDRFEQFYNDESDEWQLRNAMKVDDLIYHPICYNDHQQKLELEKAEALEKQEQTPAEEPPTESTDEPKTEEKPETTESQVDYDDDSDIEEVQVIEQPIEEIIINDENDFDEPNLETLNTEEIIAAQQEIDKEEEFPEIVPKPIKVEEPDKIVDISDLGGDNDPSYEETEIVEDSPQTKSGPEGVVTMDGNIELLDSPAQILSGSTKIKITINKNLNEDRANSPRNEESKHPSTDEIPKESEELSDIEKLVPVNLKSRIVNSRLQVYPAVQKGTEKSGLCTIM